MMGYIRLGLALIIFADHIGPIDHFARWAVIGFYLISGYGTTAAVCLKYGSDYRRFWASRIKRIMPSYWAIFILFSIIWSVYIPEFNKPYLGFESFFHWLLQLFLVIDVERPMVVPSAWMLLIMVLWWVPISVGATNTKKKTWIWVLTCIAVYTAMDITVGSKWYFTPWIAALPFGVGALGFHYGLKVEADTGKGKILGQLSYPLFLCHVPIGSIVSDFVGGNSWLAFGVALLPSFCLSWLLIKHLK